MLVSQPLLVWKSFSYAFAHVPAPSVVRHTAKYWPLQPVAGEPVVRIQPLRSSMNEIFLIPGSDGSARSCHVPPRSSDRKTREPATRVHRTPLPAGAMSA